MARVRWETFPRRPALPVSVARPAAPAAGMKFDQPETSACTARPMRSAATRQASLHGRRAGGHRFVRGLLTTGRNLRQTPPRATPSQGHDAVPGGSQRDCGLRCGRAGPPGALRHFGRRRGPRFAPGRDARIVSGAAKGTLYPESGGTSPDFPRRSRCRARCLPVPKSPADCEYEPPTAQLQTDLRVSVPARPRPRNRFWAFDADPAYSGGDGSWRSGSGGTPGWVGSDATGVEVDCSGVASCQGQRSNFGIKP